MGINGVNTAGSNNDENSDEDGQRGSKRARQLSTNIENNAENSNNSSNLHIMHHIPHLVIIMDFEVKQNEESDGIIEETRVGRRFGSESAARKLYGCERQSK